MNDKTCTWLAIRCNKNIVSYIAPWPNSEAYMPVVGAFSVRIGNI